MSARRALRALAALAFLLLAACAPMRRYADPNPHIYTQPVLLPAHAQVCVILNPSVSRPGFLQKYEGALRERGFTVRELPDRAGHGDCPIVSTYTARYWWNVGQMLVRNAQIDVYVDGKPRGVVRYEVSVNFLQDTDDVVFPLVEQLFPVDQSAPPPQRPEMS